MWDYVTYLLSFPFMVHALEAGTIVACMAAVVGWFMVLRGQTFAGHTIAMVGFPGAAGAALVGLPVTVGYFAFCGAAAATIGSLSATDSPDDAHASAVVGTTQGFALGLGFLFISLYHGLATSIDALLFGTYLGITAHQVLTLLAVAVPTLAFIALISRRLLFASVDPTVAAARGIRTGVLSTVFMLALAAAVAEAVQITGVLLVFALLVMPAATAQVLTARPGHSIVWSLLLAVTATWTGLVLAFYTNLPVGFWITTIAFGAYVAARAWRVVQASRGRPTAAARFAEVR